MLFRLSCVWIVVCVLLVSIRRSVACLKTNNSKVMIQTNGCSCQHSGKMYNIEPLGKKGGSPRYSIRAKKYNGYMYAYNPCISFEIGPSSPHLNGKRCQNDVAVCWWFPQHLDSYTNIGTQSSVECGLDDDGNPQLEYTSFRQKSRKSIVQLRCDPSKKGVDEASFEALDEDNWVFRLTHNCACAGACPVRAAKVSWSSSAINAGVVVPTVIAAIGIFLVVPIILIFRRWRRRQQEAEERRRLINRVQGGMDQPNDIDCQDDLPYSIPETYNGRNFSNSLHNDLSFNDITLSPKDHFKSVIYGNKHLSTKRI